MSRSLVVVLCLAFLSIALVAGCPKPTTTSPTPPTTTDKGEPPAAGGEIVLGSYMCNTGAFATFGQSSTKAMKLAVEEINAKGGVLGKQIRLIVEDDQCKPEEAANA
ncbi:MAG: hypothetical protein FJX75_21700, partial [Armatimonadetes bacterium]|nr:hypothetical protein [Armatimonadota bacterium]